MLVRDALEQLESSGADPRAPLAYLAGHGLEHDPTELQGAFRRAELLLATGGDPRREIDLSDHAVESVASDLFAPELADLLSTRLRALEPGAGGLPRVTEALHELDEEPELAWRVYAWALLAEHVSGA